MTERTRADGALRDSSSQIAASIIYLLLHFISKVHELISFYKFSRNMVFFCIILYTETQLCNVECAHIIG